jgi:hypothetical protein
MELDQPLLERKNATEEEAMEWNPQGQRKRGVGREYERKPWLLGRHVKKLKNRMRWQHSVNALYSSGSDGHDAIHLLYKMKDCCAGEMQNICVYIPVFLNIELHATELPDQSNVQHQ